MTYVFVCVALVAPAHRVSRAVVVQGSCALLTCVPVTLGVCLGSRTQQLRHATRPPVASQWYTALSEYSVCCWAVLVAAASCAARLQRLIVCVCRALRALHCLWLEELYSAALPALSVPLCCVYLRKQKRTKILSACVIGRQQGILMHMLRSAPLVMLHVMLHCYVGMTGFCRPCCKPEVCSHWSGGSCE